MALLIHLAGCDWGAILCQELHKGSAGVSLHGQTQVMPLPPCPPASNLWQRPCPIHEANCMLASSGSDAAWTQTLIFGVHKGRACRQILHLNLVHELHGLNDADGLALGDFVALLHK